MKRHLTIISIALVLLMAACSNKEEPVSTPDPQIEPIEAQEEYVRTLAGSGIAGNTDSQGEEAAFHKPAGIAFDQAGNLFVADFRNHVIRKVDRDGNASTIAGSANELDPYGFPIGGYSDGAAEKAAFFEPRGLAIAEDGAVYVADSGNGAIRVITPEGEVRTLIDGLRYPSGIFLGHDGFLYVSETLAHQIVKITTEGQREVIAGGNYTEQGNWLVGGFQDGKGEQAQFNEPTGIALDHDHNIYVADTGNQRIRKIDTSGNVTTLAGSGTEVIPGTTYFIPGFADGQGEGARFNFPQGIYVTEDNNILVADTHNHSIRSISTNGDVKTLTGNGRFGLENGSLQSSHFNGPFAISVHEDTIAISDMLNHVIRVISKTP